jgi:predicted dinucleotide-binding enzyme
MPRGVIREVRFWELKAGGSAPRLTRQTSPPLPNISGLFNTLGWEYVAEPTFLGGERADPFYAGDDAPVRASPIRDIGLRPVWVGGADITDALDGLTQLWFMLAVGQNYGRHTALRMLTDRR